jgi:pimeloyl-ACP methyl ester carboxylesterase
MPVVEQQGQGSVAIVLVHGTPGDAFQVAPLAARLSEVSTVLSVDLPDHGRAADESSLDPDVLLADLRSVVAALAPRPTLIAGVSLGAWLAARLLAEAPVHLRGAALFAGFEGLSEEEAALRISLAEQLEAGALSADNLGEIGVGLFLGSEQAPDAARRVRASIVETPLPRLSRALRRAAACARPDRQVQPFRRPARVIHSRDDRAIALAHGQRLAELGSAPLVILPGDAHLITWTHTDACSAAVLELLPH